MTTLLNIQMDEQTMRLMDWILSAEGYTVVNARDAAPATLAQDHQPDVIIVNTAMELDEKRACIVALRALVPWVCVLDLGVDVERDAYDTGADQYLNRPFSADDLIARVRACA